MCNNIIGDSLPLITERKKDVLLTSFPALIFRRNKNQQKGLFFMPRKRRKFKRGLSDIKKFMEYVIMSEGCWGWDGFTVGKGYGQFVGRNGNISAHRFSYLYWNGEIPKGMCVRHKCDNPSCSNPAHLMIGTHRQNMEDIAFHKPNSGRELPGVTKPTQLEIEELRKLWAEGKEYAEKLANKYNSTHLNLWKAAYLNKWKSNAMAYCKS